MKITIRQLSQDDIKIVQQLMHELGYPLDEEELLFNINIINQKNGIILGAELSGNVVGCLSAVINASLAEGMFGEIVSLVVSKEYRGSGIGKCLVKHAEGKKGPAKIQGREDYRSCLRSRPFGAYHAHPR